MRTTTDGIDADEDGHTSPSDGSAPSFTCVTTGAFAYAALSHPPGSSARLSGSLSSPTQIRSGMNRCRGTAVNALTHSSGIPRPRSSATERSRPREAACSSA